MKWFHLFFIFVFAAMTLWAAGFMWFAGSITSIKPYDVNENASAVVVLTGGDGRIDAGLNLFAARRGTYLFITSVDPSLTEQIIRERWTGETPLPECCIVLDYDAETTAHNALMTRRWIREVRTETGEEIGSIRLVTSNYHMPRALVDFRRFLPDVIIYPHPVTNHSVSSYDLKFWRLALGEYHKFMVRAVQQMLPSFLQELYQ
jgi:uncharacterized SAM-binding protein YcdF (DUF218 family)